MGGGAIAFGLCVVLVCILGKEFQVKCNPIPAPAHYDMCTYLRWHEHRSGSSGTTTPAPAEETTKKPKDEKKSQIERFNNFLKYLLELEQEADKKEDEDKKKEDDDKKKEEEEKKKKEEEEKKKKDEESKSDEESRGFKNMNEFWDSYIKMLTSLYYSF